MAHKETLKKAVQLEGGGYRWEWNGQHDVRHQIDWTKDGKTWWRVFHEDTLLRESEPWFLVTARGEVQENIKYFRNAGLDLVHANIALLSMGLMPDQHQEHPWCNCGQCLPVLEETATG
jgi:hypothetical protein